HERRVGLRGGTGPGGHWQAGRPDRVDDLPRGNAEPELPRTAALGGPPGRDGALPLPLRRALPERRRGGHPGRLRGGVERRGGLRGRARQSRSPAAERVEELGSAVAAGVNARSRETLAVHGGRVRSGFDETSEALFLTSGFVYRSAEEAESAFAGDLDKF